jgi:uncharacterized membrane protein YccC
VTSVANVEYALAEIRAEKFDVLLSDLNISLASDGFAVIDTMKPYWWPMDRQEIPDKRNVLQLGGVTDRVGLTAPQVLEHSARTAVTAVVSLLVARLFRLPETYWAPITTLLITQSSLGAALTISWQRFVGTVLGAVVGAIVASQFGPHALVFGGCVFILGLLSAVVHSDRSAYRLAGVTLAIVLLVPRTDPGWQVAFHRFAEVTIGLGVALLMTVIWPEIP